MKNIWSHRVYVFILLPITLIYSCSSETVEIGCVGTFSGHYSDLGVEVRNGLRLAVQEINDDRTRSFNVKVDYFDDEGTEEGVRKAVDFFRKKNVRIVIGPVLSTLAESAVPMACKYDMIWISPVVSSSELTRKKDCFFRTISDSSDRATRLAEYMKKRSSFQHPCAVIDQQNRAYTEDFARNFFGALGMELDDLECQYRLEEHPAVRIASSATVVNYLTAHKPDVVLIAASAMDTVIIARALQDNLPDTVIAAPLWAKTGVFLSAFGFSGSQTRIFFEDIKPATESPDLKEFFLRYKNRYGFPPSFAAVQGYDTLKVVVAALEKSKQNGTNLETELSKINNFPGLFSPITIDEYGDAHRPTFIYSLCGGKFCEEGA